MLNYLMHYLGYYGLLAITGKFFIPLFFDTYLFLRFEHFFLFALFYFPLCYFLDRKFNPPKNKEMMAASPISGSLLAVITLLISTVLYWDPSICSSYHMMTNGEIWSYEAMPIPRPQSEWDQCYEMGAVNYFGGFTSTLNGWILLIFGGFAGLIGLILSFFYITAKIDQSREK